MIRMLNDTIKIRKVNEPYGWLGNMSPYPVVHQGVTYRTTEALFQALRFNDPLIKDEIINQKSPMGAKMKAKANKVKMVVQQFSEQDITNMRLCLKLKIEQHPELRKMLLETGDKLIVEDTTKRNRECRWGAKLRDGVWVGDNLLGKLWMELRNTLSTISA